MPEISRLLGIAIAMYYNDHAPPHFHARYGPRELRVDIARGAILSGTFPPRAQRLVLEWLALHRSELMENWKLAARRLPLNRIDPLEQPMTPRLIDATYAGGYRIRLRYDDGVEAEVDLEAELWGAVFEPLRDLDTFRAFRLDEELQTVVWPNGADLAPEYLYRRATA